MANKQTNKLADLKSVVTALVQEVEQLKSTVDDLKLKALQPSSLQPSASQEVVTEETWSQVVRKCKPIGSLDRLRGMVKVSVLRNCPVINAPLNQSPDLTSQVHNKEGEFTAESTVRDNTGPTMVTTTMGTNSNANQPCYRS